MMMVTAVPGLADEYARHGIRFGKVHRRLQALFAAVCAANGRRSCEWFCAPYVAPRVCSSAATRLTERRGNDPLVLKLSGAGWECGPARELKMPSILGREGAEHGA